jgi:ComF family protein
MRMHHFDAVRRRFDQLLWRLLPGVCVLCDAPTGIAADLCEHCCAALPRLEAPCPRCALPLQNPDDALCAACRARPPPYARTVAALRYSEPVTRMIHRLKFRGSRIDARVLGGLLAASIATAYAQQSPPDLVVPVPLSRRRLLRRGHNQAALLARWLGRPFEPAACERVRDTPPQAGLSRARRLHNLADAFATRRRFDDVSVAVVDDVMTTGTTVGSLSRTLLAAGAREVHVWAAATHESTLLE